MTRKELNYIKEILSRVKPQDDKIQLALSFVDKDIKLYNSRRGQLREQYSYDNQF